MGTIEVVNRHRLAQLGSSAVYIGRGSPLGNPFKIEGQITRDKVIELYEAWLKLQIQLEIPTVIDALNGIANRVLRNEPTRLVCFCAPQKCHGDVIKRIVCEATANH